MKRHAVLWGGILAFVLLTGAGCAKSQTGTGEPATKPGDETAAPGPAGTPDATDVQGVDITKAESTSKGVLNVEFAADEALAKDVQGYRLLLANEPDPTWPTKGYWYQLGPDHRSKAWRVPSGKRHLRVCAVKNNQCAEYSESMEVEVK
ncbi:MAG: hypothetical protein UY92_C0021G0014 [Candidatus Magasanikbacteria bacterium GW2011_GWA2_56_11]|uniref:Uncharacterized protein n=1 Tax=Candidatus Magasanikbacteria bacterium GW2011_GWA2_56_11 TaxID=1619044 RepID=A0A0G1YDV6_9BACT|nr:MAG: hypothetical protein UY92_C0021G0014 [Candidatus Magasanikbacteria bacterium GW2011_GWA2_56_11]